MAQRLLRARATLTVYNRSQEPSEALRALGADVARTPEALFGTCDAVILMLADDEAVDAVLARKAPEFRQRVAGRLIVNAGTHAPAYSEALAHDVEAAGGRFVEAPVSGSRGPAEQGHLVAILAGQREAVGEARGLMAPMCRAMVETGLVPSAMQLKLAVNLYLIASVAALAEAANFASTSGVDLGCFSRVIADGPLGSSVTAAKLGKMVERDFAPQAAIRDVVKNARLVQAAGNQADTPILREAASRFEALLDAGGGSLDMAAILLSYETGRHA